MKIITHNICPPIPIRHFDWVAWKDGQDEGPYGTGPTEGEAKKDLIDLLEESEDDELEPKDRMVMIEGKSFRCPCGCNVFRSPKNKPNSYVCNACGDKFTSE